MYSRNSSELAWEAAIADASALAAMLHFRRTGERFKPQLVVVNGAAIRSLRRPPVLRTVSVRGPKRLP